MAKGTTVTTVFPDTALPHIRTQSENSDNELEQIMVHPEMATMRSVFHLNLLVLPYGRYLIFMRHQKKEPPHSKVLRLSETTPAIAPDHCAVIPPSPTPKDKRE